MLRPLALPPLAARFAWGVDLFTDGNYMAEGLPQSEGGARTEVRVPRGTEIMGRCRMNDTREI